MTPKIRSLVGDMSPDMLATCAFRSISLADDNDGTEWYLYDGVNFRSALSCANESVSQNNVSQSNVSQSNVSQNDVLDNVVEVVARHRLRYGHQQEDGVVLWHRERDASAVASGFLLELVNCVTLRKCSPDHSITLCRSTRELHAA